MIGTTCIRTTVRNSVPSKYYTNLITNAARVRSMFYSIKVAVVRFLKNGFQSSIKSNQLICHAKIGRCDSIASSNEIVRALIVVEGRLRQLCSV